MPFINDGLDAGATGDLSWYDLNPHDIARIIEVLILGLIGLLILLLVIRPLVSRILDGITESLQKVPEIEVQKENAQIQSPKPANNDEETVKIDQIEGAIKKSTLNSVAQIIDQHPDETVSLVCSWMNQ